MKKVIMMIIALAMMATVFCGCETHEHQIVESRHSDGTTDVYEYYDGELVDHYSFTR